MFAKTWTLSCKASFCWRSASTTVRNWVISGDGGGYLRLGDDPYIFQLKYSHFLWWFCVALEIFTEAPRWAPNVLAKNTKRLTFLCLDKESLKWMVGVSVMYICLIFFIFPYPPDTLIFISFHILLPVLASLPIFFINNHVNNACRPHNCQVTSVSSIIITPIP